MSKITDAELLDWLEVQGRSKWVVQTERDYPYVKGCVWLTRAPTGEHKTAREAIESAMEDSKNEKG